MTRRTHDRNEQNGSCLPVPAECCLSRSTTAGEAGSAANAWRSRMGSPQCCACAGAEVSHVHCRLSRDRRWPGCVVLYRRASAYGAAVAVLERTVPDDRPPGDAVRGQLQIPARRPSRPAGNCTQYTQEHTTAPHAHCCSVIRHVAYSIARCRGRVYKAKQR